MPLFVPRYGVQPARQPEFQAPRTVPFRDQTGEQVQQLGQDVQQAGAAALELGEARRHQVNEARAREAAALLSDAFRKQLDDPETGYRRRVGKAAVDSYEDTVQALRDQRERIAGTLTAEQRAGFDPSAEAAIQRAMSVADGHYSRQVEAYEQGELEAQMWALAQDHVTYYGEQSPQDPAGSGKTVVSDLSAAKNRARELAQRKGYGPEQTKALVMGATTYAHSGVIDKFIEAGDVLGAKTYFEANQGEIAAKAQSDYRKQFNREDLGGRAEEMVEWVQDKGGDYAARLDVFRELRRTGHMASDLFDEASKRLKQRDDREYELSRRARVEMRQQVDQLLGQNPLTTFEALPPDAQEAIDGMNMRGEVVRMMDDARAAYEAGRTDGGVPNLSKINQLDSYIRKVAEEAEEIEFRKRLGGQGSDLIKAPTDEEIKALELKQEFAEKLREQRDALMKNALRREVSPESRPAETREQSLKRLVDQVNGALYPPGGWTVPLNERPAPTRQAPQQPAEGTEDAQESAEPQPKGAKAQEKATPAPSRLFGADKPPRDYQDKLLRLLKARADTLVGDIYDDRGNLVDEGLHDPEAAFDAAIRHMSVRIDLGDGPEFRRYFETGEMPENWIHDTSVRQSPETFLRQTLERQAQETREESPAASWVLDYVVDPVGRILPATAQVFADVGFGLARLAFLPTPDDTDVESGFYADTWGVARSTARAMLDARRKTAGAGAQIAGGAGDLVGMGLGFMAGGATTALPRAVGPAPILNAGAKALEAAAGAARLGRAGRVIGHSAGTFGTYEALREAGARGGTAAAGEIADSALHGVTAGAALGLAHNIVSFGVRGMFRADARTLGAPEKKAMEALEEWGTANRILPITGESATAYEKRLIDGWISAGLPGAGKLPWKKLAAYSGRAGADGVGFSLLDQEFVKDLTENSDDPEAFGRALIKFAGNTLGAAVLHMRLSDIPLWQREQKVVDAPASEPPKGQGPAAPRPAPQDPRKPGTMTPEGEAFLESLPAKAETAEASDMARLGWKTASKSWGTTETSLPGTDLSFRVTPGGKVKVSDNLRKLLDLPETVEPGEVAALVKDASLASALRAKATLPGTEISAEGIWAEPSRGDKPGVMRTIRMGQVYESPLGPEPSWTRAERPADRAPDMLEPAQTQAVESLRDVLNARTDLPQNSRVLLGEAVNVLSRVSAKNNRGVEETLGALAEVLPVIESGRPAEAAMAARALGEMLTTKTPDIALGPVRDLAEESRAETRGGDGFGTGVFDEVPRPTGPTRSPGRSSESGAAYIPSAKELADALVQLGQAGRQMALRLLNGSLSAQAAYAYLREQEALARPAGSGRDRQAEAGVVRIPDRADIDRAVEAVVAAGAEVGVPLRDGWDLLQRSRIQEAEDIGLRDLATEARKGTTTTKQLAGRLSKAGLFEMRRLPRKQLDSMEGLVGDGIGGYATRYARARDDGIAKHFGEVRDLTEAERKVVELGHEVTLEAARIANETGVPITVDPARRRLTRQWTPEARQAREDRTGPVFEAIVGWMERALDVPRDEAVRRFTEESAVTRQDATETHRTLEVIPTHVEVNGKPFRILESRPLEHTEAMAFTNAQVMGARSVIKGAEPKKGAKGKKPSGEKFTEKHAEKLDELPVAAQELLNRIFTEHGRPAAESAARLVRAMHGMPTTRQEVPLFRRGTPGHNLIRGIGAILGLQKSGLLTLSAIRNIPEPIANAQHFGMGTILRAYKQVAKDFAAGRIGDVHRQLVEEGWIGDTHLNHPWKGDRPVETFENALRKVGDKLTKLLRISQDFNELVNANAARERLQAMQDGQGSPADRSALKLLGFSPAEATRMLRGEGAPEQYARYQTGIVGNLAGGKSLTPAEKSAAGSSRWFNSIVWFTNFFQTRMRAIDSLVRDIKEDRGDRAENFAKLVRFAGFQVASGAIGGAIYALVKNGDDGVADYLREQVAGATPEEVAENTAKSALELFTSGVLGGLGTPLRNVLVGIGEPGSSREAIADTALRLVGPASAAWPLIDFLGAAVLNSDVPGYEGMSLLEKVGKYVQQSVPAARAVHEGLFGIGAIALTAKDPELDAAEDAFWRWVRSNKQMGQRFVTDEDNRAFRDAMREAVSRVTSERFTDQDVMDALTEAITSHAEKTAKRGEVPTLRAARNAAAASLRKRRLLADGGLIDIKPDEMPSLLSHLGEDNVRRLRARDDVLEMLARVMSPGR